ncbi:MAG: spermidine/putrescine ABC transporter substrate-binding protein [Ruminococcaceae bacterium]|nr:spermidine/putrescine ABC transporter substrate-binding protein [Oscillospiraceae bacterium]
MSAASKIPKNKSKIPKNKKETNELKKAFTLLTLCALVISVALFSASCGVEEYQLGELTGTFTRDLEGTTINVFNWGQNISDGSEGSLDINKAFEEVTGIKVNYINYDSNEAMYAKLKSGAVSYDIVIPSDYMIERLINENMIQKIDLSKIDNYKYIDEQYKNVFFDPNNEYSVPYTVGMVGLIYNTTMVEGTPDSWSIMWDEAYKDNVLTFNNPRDAFAIAQFLLGQDINSTNKADWDAAAAKLKEQIPVLQGLVMDDVFNKMQSANAAIAPYYAGDYLTMADINPDLAFVYPKEGTNIFIDSMCIPANAQNYEAALMYINFMLEPEVALQNSEYIYYASPNTAVVNNPEYSLYGNEIIYPSEEAKKNTQYFHDIDPEIRSYYEKLWEEFLREFN